MTDNLVIIGAGGFGREVQMLVEQINGVRKKWNLIGYFDDAFAKGTLINGLPILGSISEFGFDGREMNVVVALGNPVVKKQIIDSFQSKSVYFPTLIHPSAIIGSFNSIGEGAIITAGNIITTNVTIGRHVVLNLCCTVGHDAVIGDYSSFMPSVNISGEVNVGDCVFVGTGTKIINQINIGSNSIIGAGSTVTKDIPANCTAVGVPAKPIKFH
jgi:sugar O-acyltransferase (sialic acid O-acetyltransferase NeuD family)